MIVAMIVVMIVVKAAAMLTLGTWLHIVGYGISAVLMIQK